MPYDVIGDIHGHGDTLRALLARLGYVQRRGAYRCPGRTAVFVGDLVDRGRQNRFVVETVRAMVDAGAALAVLGNHELNAIQYRTLGADGRPLRAHDARHTGQHAAFLHEYAHDAAAHDEAIAWFRSLPVCLERDGLRVIHAWWSDDRLARLRPWLDPRDCLTEAAVHAAAARGDPVVRALVDDLIKGPEIALPDGLVLRGPDGSEHRDARIAWWCDPGTSLRHALLGQGICAAALPDRSFPALRDYAYPDDAPPLLFGHYWFRGDPVPQRANAACLDYSVAGGGRLAAYRWDGEPCFSREKFVWVDACG